MHGGHETLELAHNFPDINIHNPRVKVPWPVRDEIVSWLRSNESHSLWISAPGIYAGRTKDYSQQWANTLRVMISSWNYHVISYMWPHHYSAIPRLPVLAMTHILNGQLAQLEPKRSFSQSLGDAHDLGDALLSLEDHLLSLSISSQGPIFCIIHGLQELDNEHEQDLGVFLRAALHGCASGRLKLLLTTMGKSRCLEMFEYTSKSEPVNISGQSVLSYLEKPSY